MQKSPTRQRRGSVVLVAPRPDATTTATTTTKKKKKTYNDDTVKKMGFRRTMRRWFGGRYKQMSKRELDELDRRITAEMRTGSFRVVQRGPQGPTADDLWEEGTAEHDQAAPNGRPPSIMSSPAGGAGGPGSYYRPPTSMSQVSRGRRYYDEYGDDYGGYQDGYGYGYNGGGGGGASSDSGYAAGYYERPALPPPPPLLPSLHQSPAWYVPSGGPFDMAEARPESVYDGGSRANSMRSNVTRASRRPSIQPGGYYPPARPFRDTRSFSAQSDPGRLYARSPHPRMPYLPPPLPPPRDEQYYDDGGYEHGRGGGGGGVEGEGGYGYRGWNGEDIVEHEYPIDNRGYGEDYHYRGS
ncbi:hypothetical protein VSDG_00117 [Cytospora chrysosperma]|uniref:Uncharacterized protein n=1 Tax=Cytospora chrysosperma TaxID=252740 RepID=A0A423WPJ8_CYTCH|nr:hypothetical protein VSDG_00117 [Valsa sordida]